jgi:hypothetical protein
MDICSRVNAAAALCAWCLQVLCASNDAHDTVVPVAVPEGVPNGERITVPGYTGTPLEEVRH